MRDLPKLTPFRHTIIILFLFSACSQVNTISAPIDNASSAKQISSLLDSFNLAAAKADYNRYFGYYTDDAIFTGTDATERWDKKEFMVWAKPYFDKGHTWNFKTIDRHIYFDSIGNTAWFDELLNTQMKVCRGSGVLVKAGNDWKIKQYILSATIPNDLIDSVVALKAPIEDSIIKSKQNEAQ